MVGNKSLPTLVFTGGHHSSSLALANHLHKLGWQIIWVGHRHSQWRDKSDSAEYLEVTAGGYRFIDLKAGKIYRTYHPLKLMRVPLGFIQAFFILLNLKLQLKTELRGIVSFGGYLGAPVVIGGWLLHIPSITHEQTVSAGWANKLIALFAKKIAVSWPSSLAFYPKTKTVFTGLPLRPEIVQAAKVIPPSRSDVVYVTGGKQGSHVINQAVFAALPQLLEKYILIHQTGSSSVYSDYHHALKIKQSLPDHLAQRYQVESYLPAALAAQHLRSARVVVSRSGAHIIQELLIFQTRSVLIPIEWSSHSEQIKNAQILAQVELAVILPQSELNGPNLLKAVTQAELLSPQKFSVYTDGLEKLAKLVESEFGFISR